MVAELLRISGLVICVWWTAIRLVSVCWALIMPLVLVSREVGRWQSRGMVDRILLPIILKENAYIIRVDISNIFDLDVHLNKVRFCIVQSRSWMHWSGIPWGWNDTNRLFDKTALALSWEYLGDRSGKVDYGVLRWYATCFEGSSLAICGDRACVDKPLSDFNDYEPSNLREGSFVILYDRDILTNWQ